MKNVQIPELPAKITRGQLQAALETLGLEGQGIQSVTLTPNTIEVTGSVYYNNTKVTHTTSIPVMGPWPSGRPS